MLDDLSRRTRPEARVQGGFDDYPRRTARVRKVLGTPNPGGEFFRDYLPDIHSKDASLQLFGAWIIELSELSGMGRSELETVKQFISRQVESLRRPYGHHTEDVPRSCVFAGTTNSDEYLADDTGNRRFWPVRVGIIKLNELQTDRDQLWAEAVRCYENGEKWHLEHPNLVAVAEEEASARIENDPWLPEISDYVAGMNTVRVEQVLEYVKVEIPQMTQVHRRRAGRGLRQLGFEASRTKSDGRCFKRRTEKE